MREEEEGGEKRREGGRVGGIEAGMEGWREQRRGGWGD